MYWACSPRCPDENQSDESVSNLAASLKTAPLSTLYFNVSRSAKDWYEGSEKYTPRGNACFPAQIWECEVNDDHEVQEKKRFHTSWKRKSLCPPSSLCMEYSGPSKHISPTDSRLTSNRPSSSGSHLLAFHGSKWFLCQALRDVRCWRLAYRSR